MAFQFVAMRPEQLLPSSAFAVASALRTSTPMRLHFSWRSDEDGVKTRPSVELLRLCSELVGECSRKLQHKLDLTVYVRTPECYGSDSLEFRELERNVLLVFTSDIQPSLQQAEVFLCQREAVELPDFKAMVLPLTRELCLVGMLVAERLSELPSSQAPQRVEEEISSDSIIDIEASNTESLIFSIEETKELIRLAELLALACVMDQRVALLQYASWNKSVKVDGLLEQARGSLSALRTFGKLLLPHFRKGEISRDVLQDMLLQGDHVKSVVEEIQEVLYWAMAMGDQGDDALDNTTNLSAPQQWTIPSLSENNERDAEVPMPPPTLFAQDRRSCIVAEVVSKLGEAGTKLASKKKIQAEVTVEAGAESLEAAVDGEALRQAVSKLLDNAIQRARGDSSWIRVKVSRAPGGGVLILMEDNGTDMSMVMQAGALGPLGPAMKKASLGLDVKLAREILEVSGAVLRITSPFLSPKTRNKGGGGGMRVEIWLPSTLDSSNDDQTQSYLL